MKHFTAALQVTFAFTCLVRLAASSPQTDQVEDDPLSSSRYFHGDYRATFSWVRDNFDLETAIAAKNAGELVEEDSTNEDEGVTTRGSAELGHRHLWRGGIVHWQLETPAENRCTKRSAENSCDGLARPCCHFDNDDIKLIRDTFVELGVKTGLTFIEGNGPLGYIHVRFGGGCAADVGFDPNCAVILDYPCRSKGIIMHEVLHALGMFHEQESTDRDDYVEIFWNRMPRDAWHQFSAQPDSNDFGFGFDYDSVMMYSRKAFSFGNSDSMIAQGSIIPGQNEINTNRMGSRRGLSDIDSAQLQVMYHCAKAHPTIFAPRDPRLRAREVWELCDSFCPCFEGQGNCRNDDDCAGSLRCVQNYGRYTHLGVNLVIPRLNVCLPSSGSPTPSPTIRTNVPATENGAWGNIVTLRDASNIWVEIGRPSEGFHLSPLVLQTTTNGDVVVEGFGRRGAFKCGEQDAETGRTPITFRFSPTQPNNPLSKTQQVAPNTWYLRDDDVVKENIFRRNRLNTLMHSTAVNAYNTLGTTQVFVGGTALTYPDPEPHFSNGEKGLGQVRSLRDGQTIFSDEAVVTHGPLGSVYAPAMVPLANDRILVVQSFADCCDENYAPRVGFLNSARAATARGPAWQAAAKRANTPSSIKAAPEDVSHAWALPYYLELQGITTHAAVMGAAGVISFLNTDEFHVGDRFPSTPRHGATRPGGCGAAHSTSALLATNEIMIAGGCRAFIDLYDIGADSWSSIGTQIRRAFGNAVLLPDGNVLLINGIDPTADKHTGAGGAQGDPRTPQLYNPFTKQVRNLNDAVDPGNGQSTIRGEHSTAVLLNDGSILVGGGKQYNADGTIACDQPTLQMFSPPYLAIPESVRPRIIPPTDNIVEFELDSGISVVLNIDLGANQVPLRDSPNDPSGPVLSGVVLMGYSSSSHGLNQGQRYIPLQFETVSSTQIRVRSPASPRGLTGEFMLFVVNLNEAISNSITVRVNRATGLWYRTVVFIEKETVPGEDIFIRGGHDDNLKGFYNNRMSEVIVYRNLQAGADARMSDGTIDWFSNSPLAWTCQPGTSEWHENNEVYYDQAGYGIDGENQWGKHNWKFEVYMKKLEVPSNLKQFDDWFEFKAFLRLPSGEQVWEQDVRQEALPGSLRSPSFSINHWAKIGALTRVKFGENGATVFDLNEPGIPESYLPYIAGSRSNPVPRYLGFTQSEIIGLGAGIIIAVSFVGVFVVYKHLGSRDNESIADDVDDIDVDKTELDEGVKEDLEAAPQEVLNSHNSEPSMLHDSKAQTESSSKSLSNAPSTLFGTLASKIPSFKKTNSAVAVGNAVENPLFANES